MTLSLDERLDEELLQGVLARALELPAARIAIVGGKRLKKGVHRLQLTLDGDERSVIVKRVAPEVARRNRLVAERWLPAVGLEGAVPAVLGSTIGPDPQAAWLVCQDLGTRPFSSADPARVGAAVALIARLHRSFADHALLGEGRLWGGDLGASFYTGNLRDALRAVEALREPAVSLSRERAALRDRLRARLGQLLEDAPRRAELMGSRGGPETLLHGDLWLENLVEVPCDGGFELRLIDWDHAGIGPMVYDVSTFLYRFPPRARPGVWEAYRRALGPGLWDFPEQGELALLCETAEHARIANLVIWPALAILRGEEDSSYEGLAMVAGWFDELGPLFP